MTWTGLPTQTLWLAAVVGTGILLLLFLLRPRPQVLLVPSHVLWNKVLPRRMNPLMKELIALLLQILALLAVVGALGRPVREVESIPPPEEAGIARPTDRVVVADCSASMAAVEEDGQRRIDLARAGIEELIADMSEGERMALVVAGPEPTVAVPLTDDPQRLGLAVRTLRAGPGRADLPGALERARSLLVGAEPPLELRVFTDDPTTPPDLPPDAALIWAPVGRPRPNVAVTSFDVRATEGLPARLEALVGIDSFADRDARVTVSVETATRVLGRASYTLPAGGSLDRVYQFAPPEEDRVEVVLREIQFLAPGGEGDVAPAAADGIDSGMSDALEMDDHAFTFLPQLRPARVLLVTRGNQYLRAALHLIPGLKLEVVAPDDFPRGRVVGGRYDVVFYDSFVPDDLPRENAFFINPPRAAGGFSLQRRVEAPTTSDWNLGHPLFANLVLRDLNVAVSGQFEPRPGDVRLIGTPTGPIAVAREQGDLRLVAFGFDFADSDLPLRVGFPQLIFNTVLWMREGRATGPPAGLSVLARDPAWWEPAAGEEQILVERMLDPDQSPVARGREIPAGDGPVRHQFERVGFFSVTGAEDDRPVAVSMLDPRESDLRGTAVHPEPASVPPPVEVPEPPEPLAPIWVWLGLAALLLMVGEFGVINR